MSPFPCCRVSWGQNPLKRIFPPWFSLQPSIARRGKVWHWLWPRKVVTDFRNPARTIEALGCPWSCPLLSLVWLWQPVTKQSPQDYTLWVSQTITRHSGDRAEHKHLLGRWYLLHPALLLTFSLFSPAFSSWINVGGNVATNGIKKF